MRLCRDYTYVETSETGRGQRSKGPLVGVLPGTLTTSNLLFQWTHGVTQSTHHPVTSRRTRTSSPASTTGPTSTPGEGTNPRPCRPPPCRRLRRRHPRGVSCGRPSPSGQERWRLRRLGCVVSTHPTPRDHHPPSKSPAPPTVLATIVT